MKHVSLNYKPARWVFPSEFSVAPCLQKIFPEERFGRCAGFPFSTVKNYSPGYMEQTPRRGHEANSTQSGLGVGCKLCSSSIKAARAECTCTGAAHTHTSLILCCGGFLVPVSPAWRDEARRVEVQYRATVRGALCLSLPLSKPLQRRCTVHMGIEALCAAPPKAPSLQVGPVAAVGVGHFHIVRHLLV